MRYVKEITIAALIGIVILLILLRGCGFPQPNPDRVTYIYDTTEVVIRDSIIVPQTITKITEKEVIRWKHDTTIVTREGRIDTVSIVIAFLDSVYNYSESYKDTNLSVDLEFKMFQNKLRDFELTYKILRPTKIIEHKPDRFQFHVLGSIGTATDFEKVHRIRPGLGFMLEFRSGTSILAKYDHTFGHQAPHGVEIMVAQRLRFRKPKVSDLLLLQ